MRDSIENISQLQKQLNDLQLENQILKNILDKAGLSYHKELSAFRQNDTKEDYDPEQGKRIIYPQIITENMANQFFGMFWGRQDVYAKRSVNKGTGKAAYYPQCNNLWTSGCHRKLKDGINCKDCKIRSYKTITKFIILNHLQGNSYNGSDVIGVYHFLVMEHADSWYLILIIMIKEQKKMILQMLMIHGLKKLRQCEKSVC